MFGEVQNYFYHSFPRRREDVDPVEKGLEILRSLVELGLVLAPETRHWRQPNLDGTFRERHTVERRISFTELSPRQLRKHAKRFGPFALEFKIEDLRHMGALPVFYVPQSISTDTGASAVGLSFVFQIYDCQYAIGELIKLRTALQQVTAGQITLQNIDQNQVVVSSYVISTAALRDVLSYLQFRTSPFEMMSGTLEGLFNLFCPTEPTKDRALIYYREREWRLIGNIARSGGQSYTNKIEEKDAKKRLIDIDRNFWTATISSGSRQFRRVDDAFAFRQFEGVHIFNKINRIIVPSIAVKRARAIIEDANLRANVVSSRTFHLHSLFERCA
jgi:hypothetical protein